MPFTPGIKYAFYQKLRTNIFFGKRIEQPSEYSRYATRMLTFLRDERGDWRSTGERVVHHIFQLSGGALECFTNQQLQDFDIKEAALIGTSTAKNKNKKKKMR